MSDKITISVLLDYYGVLLSDKQRNIMECYYFDDLSLSEIAENEGITRQGVRDVLKRCEAALIEYDGKLNLIKKIDQLKISSSSIDKNLIDSNIQLRHLTELIDNL